MREINNIVPETSSMVFRFLIRGFAILIIILNSSSAQAWAQTHNQVSSDETIREGIEAEITLVDKSPTPSKILLAETEPCYPGIGWKWVYGSFQPEIAAEVQQSLVEYGIVTLIKARSFGEVDSCGTFKPFSLDFLITLQSETPIDAARQEELTETIYPVLLQHSTLELGRVEITFFPTGDKKIIDSSLIDESEFYITESNAPAETTLNRKVYVVVYDPLLSNGQTLSEYLNWNNHTVITQGVINFFENNNNNWMQYTLVETEVITDAIEGWPIKVDGYRYTEAEYLDILNGLSPPHAPDTADYNSILASPELDICGKLNRDEIDEVWLYGGSYFGFYESRLAGPDAFLYNSLPVPEPNNCDELLPIMGLNYQRGLQEAVHIFGHRAEATMIEVYGSWQRNRTAHNWERFSLVETQSPDYDYGGCGNIHYPPNGTSDYDYANPSVTHSNCDDFENYPVLGDPSQTAIPVNCNAWNCSGLGYFEYWFDHLPENNGCGPDNVANSWWIYFADPTFALDPPTACNLSAGVRIDGKSIGLTDVTQIFTAITSPISVTLPVTYTWQATGHDQITYIDSALSNTITLTWPTTGAKIITVTATHANGILTDTHEIIISTEITEAFPITQGSDDAGQFPACSFTTNAREIYLGKCTNGQGITSGFRFADIAIPRASNIRNAYIEFTVDGTYNNEIAVAFIGEASSNALTFSTTDRPENRPLTSISTTWSIPAVDIWYLGETRQSQDLTGIIQEIIDLSDWESGNALAIISRNAGDASLPNDHRRVMAYERFPIGKQSARLIVTFAAPIAIEADFVGTNLIGVAPLTAVFTDTSQGRISNWWWDFGDGTTADIENPTHVYTSSGVYSVTHTVTGSMGTDTITRTNYVTVTEPPPLPDLTIAKVVDPTTVSAGETITYTLEFSNAGEATATGVVITDIVPISVTNTSVISSGVSITQTAPGYVWDVHDLIPGEGGLITITGVVSDNLGTSTFSNTATITGITPDFDLSNNTSSVIVTVDTLYTTTLSFSVGWNLISTPVQPSNLLTAQGLLDKLNEQDLACTEVDRWLDGSWDGYLNGQGFNNFTIFPGQSYFVLCSTPTTWQLLGSSIKTSIPISLSTGWNLLSVPYPSSFQAQSLLDEVVADGGSCSEIDQWLWGSWDGYLNGQGFNNFDILPDQGYFLLCNSSSTFTP